METATERLFKQNLSAIHKQEEPEERGKPKSRSAQAFLDFLKKDEECQIQKKPCD